MKKLTILNFTLMAGLLFAASAKAQTIYVANFSGSGNLQGSSPDTDNYQNAVWTNGPYFAPASLTYSAGTVSEVAASYNYLDAFLPVNSAAAYAGQPFGLAPTSGRSGGPSLDGSVGFTETVTGTPTAKTYLTLDLYNGTPYGSSFGGQASADGGTLASLQVGAIIVTTVAGNQSFDFGQSAVGAGPVTLSMTYNPVALTLTLATSPLIGLPAGYSQTVTVTKAEIAGITGVGFSFSSDSDAQDATVNQFTFAEAAVPEPSTWATLLCGLGALAFLGNRRKRSAV